MPALSTEQISALLTPYLEGAGAPELYQQLSVYLDLLLKWNARTNLTAIRSPEEIVQRHFGESLFCARHLPGCSTLLDLGSGAGFPGLPIQLLRPKIAVTLAESQNKKASFLREIVRSLGLATEIWLGRAEAMPPARSFEGVTLRAVDRMPDALYVAGSRSSHYVGVLTASLPEVTSSIDARFELTLNLPIPQSHTRFLLIYSLNRKG